MNNNISFKLVVVSKIFNTFISLFVAYFDPNILKCDDLASFVCSRKKTAIYGIIPMGLSISIMISVSLYFVRKVYCLSKVNPTPILEDPGKEMNTTEENVVRRMNQNPNQFFRVKISKALESFPSTQEPFPIVIMVKKALIVNIVSLCQIAFLFPLYVLDFLLLFKFFTCDDERFSRLSLTFGTFGLLFNICFPVLLEKKLDRFCLQ